jgi:hypothetical protein
LTNNLSERVEQGQELIIEGTSEPGADILLEIYSEPFTAHTVADADGYFRIGVDTGSLSLGNHELYLTATDKAGNYLRKKIADFELIAKSSSASAAIAYAEEETVASDIKPPVIPKEVNQTEEVAKAGETSSTQDTRNGINWSVWIILLAVVVLVSAVGAAGYYGYEWIMASSATTVVRKSTAAGEIKKDQKETIRHRTQKSTVVKKSSPPSDIKEDEGEPRTRW